MKCREELAAQSQFLHNLCHLQRSKLLLNLKEKLTVLLGGEILHTRDELTVRTGQKKKEKKRKINDDCLSSFAVRLKTYIVL